MGGELLTAEELAKRFGVSVRTVYRWTSERTIPHVKLPGGVRFDPDRIEDWLQSRSVNPARR